MDKHIGKKYPNKLNRDCTICSNCTNPNQKCKIYYHTFWQIGDWNELKKNFYLRTLKLNIMSYLSTQNLCCTQLLVWTLNDFPLEIKDYLTKTFSYYIKDKNIEFKTFDLKELCSTRYESSFINHTVCLSESDSNLTEYKLIGLSDFIRFFVLDIYGGIYTDGDVIYLKNMELLWGKNFVYRWSFTEYFNTAVLGMNLGLDEFYKNLINLGTTIKELMDLLHPRYLAKILLNIKDLQKYHSLLFDPAWLCFDGVTPRYSNISVCKFSEFNDAKFISKDQFTPYIFFPEHLHIIYIW